MANDTNTKTHAAVLERMRDELLREANRLDTTPHMTGGYEREKAEAIQAGIEALRAAERYERMLAATHAIEFEMHTLVNDPYNAGWQLRYDDEMKGEWFPDALTGYKALQGAAAMPEGEN